MDASIVNAQSVRSEARVPRSLVVTGDVRQASYWRTRMANTLGPGHSALVEEGNKGNFLGTLQAYRTFNAEQSRNHQSVDGLEQLVMLVGAGTRLSPLTQALANMKSALPMPDVTEPEHGRTIGEYAIKSTLPIITCLHDGGFDGLVVRWGDEVQVPSHLLRSRPGQFADVDAVRFGWRTEPTELLATQKEWMLADDSGIVMRDVVRQPLPELLECFASVESSQPVTAYVNLGSLAASHQLLEISCEVFGDEIADPRCASNWDPYFWMALQCDSVDEWAAQEVDEATRNRSGIRDLQSSQPDFFSKVQLVKKILERRAGRALRVAVLDFGEPYWFDVGSHFALRKVLSDVFSDSADGRIVRAMLGVPDSVAIGDSVILGSDLADGVTVRNSIVLGATIRDATSLLDGAIVLGGEYGRLQISRGGVAMHSHCESLTVEGPHGIAFRLRAAEYTVHGRESVATLVAGADSVTLRYHDSLGSINAESFAQTVLGNRMSFREASILMSKVDPSHLEKVWSSKVWSST